MNKIFAGYERNVRALKKPESVYIPNSETMPHYGIMQRVVTASRTSYVDESSGFEILSIPGETAKYASFLADPADMEIYSENELETLRAKPLPIDRRSDPQRRRRRGDKRRYAVPAAGVFLQPKQCGVPDIPIGQFPAEHPVQKAFDADDGEFEHFFDQYMDSVEIKACCADTERRVRNELSGKAGE